MVWKANLRFGTQEKTLLEQIIPILRLGNIFGTALFTLSQETVLIRILLSAPLQIIFVASCVNFSDIFNMFRSRTKYEHVVDVLFFVVAIAGTMIRPIYFFVYRKRHKQIVLDIHKMNCSLGMEKRQRFVPNVPLTYTLLMMIIMSFLSTVFFIEFHMINLTVGNIIAVLIIFQSSLVNDITEKTIAWELRNSFVDINDNIMSCITQNRIAEYMLAHRKLAKLSLEFNYLCSTPLIVNLSLNITLTVWLVYTCVIMTIVQVPSYQYILALTLWRIIFSLVYFRVVTDTWDHIRKEVSDSV